MLGSSKPAVRIDRLVPEDGAFDLGQRLLTLSRVDVAAVVLTPLQPYIDSVAKLDLHSGELSTQGSLRNGMKDLGADLA
ncbi:MAG: hypothetical protein P8Y74_17920 [Desulfobacterales bacterium]